MPQDFNALTLAHQVIASHVRQGAVCIDATAGRGRDTAYLCGLVGPTGRVLAMDIQPDAVASTQALLEARGYEKTARVVQDSHSNMASYAAPGSVDCIVFNLGWLPGGSHSVFTRPETTIAAIKAGLPLLKPGGLMSLCIYYGRDCGFEERDALLAFLPTLDSARYSALVTQFCNRPNNPPIPVFVFRETED